MQPLPPVASGGVERVAQLVPGDRGAPANPNLDSAEIIAAESVAPEPVLEVAEKLVRAHPTAEYSKRDQRFRHDRGSYAAAVTRPSSTENGWLARDSDSPCAAPCDRHPRSAFHALAQASRFRLRAQADDPRFDRAAARWVGPAPRREPNRPP
jgi:hypothetical protein